MTLLDGCDFSIKHIFRECNKVANELARVGALGEHFLFLDSTKLSREVRDFYILRHHLCFLDLLVVGCFVKEKNAFDLASLLHFFPFLNLISLYLPFRFIINEYYNMYRRI